MQLLFALGGAMGVTAANSASPELGLSLDVVVEVFDGKNCVGRNRAFLWTKTQGHPRL